MLKVLLLFFFQFEENNNPKEGYFAPEQPQNKVETVKCRILSQFSCIFYRIKSFSRTSFA
jgi:hypothetical protein